MLESLLGIPLLGENPQAFRGPNDLPMSHHVPMVFQPTSEAKASRAKAEALRLRPSHGARGRRGAEIREAKKTSQGILGMVCKWCVYMVNNPHTVHCNLYT